MKEKGLIVLLYNLLKRNKRVTFLDNHGKLTTVHFIFPGEINLNEGPDLQNAKFVINNNTILGDIEFHINSIDWIKHNHYSDEKYNNVKLHIVLNFNSKFRIEDANHRRIKTLSLKNHKQLLDKIYNFKTQYESLYINFPCNYLLKREKNYKIIDYIFKLMGIRYILSKINRYKRYLNEYLKKYKNKIDAYNQVIYLALLRAFGYEKNKNSFENFGKIVDYKRVKAFKKETTINYFLKNIKKSRNMPCNAPFKRLSQLFALLTSSKSLFEDILFMIRKSNSINDITEILQKAINKNSEYKIGQQRLKIIIYNAILPVIYIYSKEDLQLKEKIFRYWLHTRAFENNHIIRKMKNILLYNFKNMTSEIELHGIMFLYNNFCKYKRCEDCPLYIKMK